jgi:hypothetical protein
MSDYNIHAHLLREQVKRLAAEYAKPDAPEEHARNVAAAEAYCDEIKRTADAARVTWVEGRTYEASVPCAMCDVLTTKVAVFTVAHRDFEGSHGLCLSCLETMTAALRQL